MMRFFVFWILGISAVGAAAVDFNREVRPILSDHCFACHGLDEKTRKAGLRLDVAEEAYQAIDGVTPIKPGDASASSVMQRVLSADEDEVMPPPKFHKPLTAVQVETLRRWIDEGAVYQGHWAFEPQVKPALPERVDVGAEPRNGVDFFVQQRLLEEGLRASVEADRVSLIRRLTLDLTGLPPSPDEVDAFVRDEAADAYDRLVSRLLESERYGEHFGRHWLDAARYADTHGLHLDNERSMWPYRDWVVRAFNENLSFDQFTIWQLAGDLLPDASMDQKVASGFNRCNVTTSEGGSINEEFVFRYAVDRTDTTVAVWLGLTAGCAQCHDHKFDPISQKEFYSLYAFFNSAADPAMDGNILLTPPILRLSDDAQSRQLQAFDAEIAAVKQQIREGLQKLDYVDPASLEVVPAKRQSELVWFEDAFPEKVKVSAAGGPTRFVSKDEGPVFSGERALQRTAKGVAQDYFSSGVSLDIPPNGKIQVQCFLDAEDPPVAVMLQFHTAGWNHRAVWGEEGAIPFGKVRTPERVKVGNLPETGKWVKLEVDALRLGLKPGAKVTGFAFTQFGGTVTWDRLAVTSVVEPAKDPRWSFRVWSKQNQGKRVADLPTELMTLVRGKKPEEWTEVEGRKLLDWWLENEYEGAQEVIGVEVARKLRLEAERKVLEDAIPATFIMADLPERRESFVMERGLYDAPGEKVERGTPAIFPALPEKADYTRLDLAEWLVSDAHPLTARVAVNRFWQQLFGVGLVKTSNDFGSQGEAPSHPELLDWLAVTFRESGWDVKALVRLLVSSHSYRQSSRFVEPMASVDPENRLLWRGARYRLDAEVVRDTALFVSGLLNPKMGGKSVKPYQPENIWEPVAFGGSNTKNYIQDHGEDLYRRSLYTFWKRTAPPPNMTAFDAPNRESYCLQRERSNTPLQALTLMNDIQFVEAARAFAQRALLTVRGDEARLRWMWRQVLGREAEAGELAVMLKTLEQQRSDFQAERERALLLIQVGESVADAALDAAELAAWTMLGNLLLNLDEVVTRS